MTTVDLGRLNMHNYYPECPCGSGEEAGDILDSRGIYLARGCETCLPDKLKGYREDVLYGPTYQADEPIEPEDDMERVAYGLGDF